MFYQLLRNTHSLTAYIVLLTLCFAVINAGLGWWQKRKYEKKDLRIGLFALIFTHIQVSLGLILYFVTPLFQSWSAMGAGVMKDAYLRKMLVEHPFGQVPLQEVGTGTYHPRAEVPRYLPLQHCLCYGGDRGRLRGGLRGLGGEKSQYYH